MVKAVRGAVSLDLNTEQDLQDKVGDLFDRLQTNNGFKEQDVISIIFSQTPDISYNPAKALRISREYNTAPLFCTQEPVCIDFPQKMMLRVIVTFHGSETPPVPVYLGNAGTLRSDRS